MSKEPLAFSTVSIGISQLLTDENGFFYYQSKDSIVHLSVSHIGYYDYTDSLIAKNKINIGLISSVGNVELCKDMPL